MSATRRQLLTGLVGVGLAGCGKAEEAREAPGVHELQDRIRGINRNGQLIIPAGLTGRVPMLVALHDTGEDHSHMVARWQAECATRGWVGLFPDYERGDLKSDHEYIGHLIVRATALGGADPGRVFIVGQGAGGRRAYAMASNNALAITAIAASSAVVRFLANDMGGQDPVGAEMSVLHIHGGADTVVPVAGGLLKGADRLVRPIAPLAEGLKPWIDLLKGGPAPMTLTVPTRVDAARWAGSGREVVRVIDPEQGHAWNTEFGTRLVAEFFAAQPSRGTWDR